MEEEKAMGRRMVVLREGATSSEILNRKIDVGLGTFFSNTVMFFVILCCASTLHRHGVTSISSTKQAAEARLRPLAGNFATLLYTLGLIGVGLPGHPDARGLGGLRFRRDLRLDRGA